MLGASFFGRFDATLGDCGIPMGSDLISLLSPSPLPPCLLPETLIVIVGDGNVGLLASPDFFDDFAKKVVVRAWGAFRPLGDFRPSVKCWGGVAIVIESDQGQTDVGDLFGRARKWL